MSYLQYGCGFFAPDRWINFDASPTLRFERIPIIGKLYTRNSIRFPTNVRYGDIVKGLSVPENSCKGIYCSHVLEHLTLSTFRIALKNTYKILSSGGYFRLVLPDLEYAIIKYSMNSSPDAALVFLKSTALGQEYRNQGLKGFIKEWFGKSRHLWMWDYKSIEVELADTGFVNIRRAEYGDCIDLRFSEVEDKERWNNCLGVECRKK